MSNRNYILLLETYKGFEIYKSLLTKSIIVNSMYLTSIEVARKCIDVHIEHQKRSVNNNYDVSQAIKNYKLTMV